MGATMTLTCHGLAAIAETASVTVIQSSPQLASAHINAAAATNGPATAAPSSSSDSSSNLADTMRVTAAALLRHATQLDKAQLAQENAMKAELQQLRNEQKEMAAKLAQMRAALLQTYGELEDTREALLEEENAAAEQAEQSRRNLLSLQYQLDSKAEALEQTTASAAAAARESNEEFAKLLKREAQSQTLRFQVQNLDREKAKLAAANAMLTQDKAQLQQQLDERTAELVTAQSQIAATNASQAERIFAVI
jgi:chromosome segregation ATPase